MKTKNTSLMSRFFCDSFIICLFAMISFFLNGDAAKPKLKNKFFIVIYENESAGVVLNQPIFALFAQKGTTFTNYFAINHPSLPNYIALAGGDDFGLNQDSPSPNITAKNLVDLLEEKGLSWKLYAENVPHSCFKKDAGPVFPESCDFSTYSRDHNPFINFKDVSTNPERCNKIVNAREFFNDVVAGTVPDFAFYIPNRLDDAHDTTIQYANNMLGYTFTLALADNKFMKDRVFVITFDESGEGDPNNDVFTAFIGPNVLANNTVNTLYTHYSLLRTVEQELGLGTLGRNDAKSVPMTGWQN